MNTESNSGSEIELHAFLWIIVVMAHATFQAGELTAEIGDNGAAGDHRAGYNGVWNLRHSKSSRSLFVPAYAGLNTSSTGKRRMIPNISSSRAARR
jgi:hypothetical protein